MKPMRSSVPPSTLRAPARKPSAGSAGVDGVLVVLVRPVSSSTATTSVNVPPVSMPMRTRRSVMAETLALRYPSGKGPRGSADAEGVEGPQDGSGRRGHVEPPGMDELARGQADRRPDREVHRDRAGGDDR